MRLSTKVIFTIISLYLCDQIIHMKSLQIIDTKWDKIKCKPFEDGYEYNNIVIYRPGITENSPSIDCWHYCYINGCFLKASQPETYGYVVRFLVAGIVMINFIVLEY